MKQEEVTETIEHLIGELHPARQQAAKRNLAKLHEENPAALLLFELTLMKLSELQPKPPATPVTPLPSPTLDFGKLTTGIESAKQAIVDEVAEVQKSLGKLNRIAEDSGHIRICSDRTESKLDVLRPYRLKVALIALGIAAIIGITIGLFVGAAYERNAQEGNSESRQS